MLTSQLPAVGWHLAGGRRSLGGGGREFLKAGALHWLGVGGSTTGTSREPAGGFGSSPGTVPPFPLLTLSAL